LFLHRPSGRLPVPTPKTSSQIEVNIVQTMNQGRSSVETAAACATEAVRDFPMTSMLVVFGVGMAVGLVLVDSLGESVGKVLDRDPSMSEKLGRNIAEALKAALPESVVRQFVA
jgi:hypothetical protein